MRPDNDLGLIARERLGSARLERAGRRILWRRTSGEAHLILRRPDPRIVFILFERARVPWVSEDVMKLLRQIPIRSNVPIKSFLLPYRPCFPFSAIDFASGERFQRTHQLS